MRYLQDLLKTVLLLLVVLLWGCESPVQPEKVVIHYSSTLFIDGDPWLYNCDDLVHPENFYRQRYSDQEPITIDSVVISNSEVVAHLWTMSQPTHFIEKRQSRHFFIRICVLFFDTNDMPMRTVWLSHFYIMRVDGTEYRRDVPLFSAIVEQFPVDYLKMDDWFSETYGDSAKNYYYDPETDFYKDDDGNFLMRSDGITIVPASQITGDPSDRRYFYRKPASKVTNNSADTGYYYIDRKDMLLREDHELVYLDGNGNVAFPKPPGK